MAHGGETRPLHCLPFWTLSTVCCPTRPRRSRDTNKRKSVADPASNSLRRRRKMRNCKCGDQVLSRIHRVELLVQQTEAECCSSFFPTSLHEHAGTHFLPACDQRAGNIMSTCHQSHQVKVWNIRGGPWLDCEAFEDKSCVTNPPYSYSYRKRRCGVDRGTVGGWFSSISGLFCTIKGVSLLVVQDLLCRLRCLQGKKQYARGQVIDLTCADVRLYLLYHSIKTSSLEPCELSAIDDLQ